jgi:4-amino-4-deoxychorismate lyase
VTRGDAGRGYRPEPGSRPTRICRRFDWPTHDRDWHETGVEVRWCATRLAIQPALAGCKHLNRLEQVLARAEWTDPRVVEGLMLDTEGTVVSGTQSNLFVVRDGELLTAGIDRCGVSGVVRGAVLDAAHREGFSVRECRLAPADLATADEIFLTSAIIGIWPVVALDGRRWAVGAVTRRAQAWLSRW